MVLHCSAGSESGQWGSKLAETGIFRRELIKGSRGRQLSKHVTRCLSPFLEWLRVYPLHLGTIIVLLKRVQLSSVRDDA